MIGLVAREGWSGIGIVNYNEEWSKWEVLSGRSSRGLVRDVCIQNEDWSVKVLTVHNENG